MRLTLERLCELAEEAEARGRSSFRLTLREHWVEAPIEVARGVMAQPVDGNRSGELVVRVSVEDVERAARRYGVTGRLPF